MLLLVTNEVRAQNATISGFVTDSLSNQPLEDASVFIEDQGGVLRGTVTDRDGLYLISGIPAGRYYFSITFVGYYPFRDTLNLAPGEVRNLSVTLVPGEIGLGEIVLQAERPGGAAQVIAGQQTLRIRNIELVPTPDLSGDLASYLTTLPGVVATGDRGGQLFIRGGEPSQNLVLLDGMPLYQPFHVLGFYSAFPSDIIGRTDVYAGAFPSKFGERISSVLDIWTRNGNNRRFEGSASVSPFLLAGCLEGPVVRNRASFLASVRRSMVESWAEPIVNRRLPFAFNDAFFKLHTAFTGNSRLSVSGVHTYDRGTLREDTGGIPPEEVRWRNGALGVRYLALPRILPVIADFRFSVSHFDTELGAPEAPSRISSVRDIQFAFEMTMRGERVNADIGMNIRQVLLESELGGTFQNISSSDVELLPFALYIEPEFYLSESLRLRTGLRLQSFQVRLNPFFEPRLRLIWERGNQQIGFGAGLFHQELMALNDRRDAASVFTAWSYIPKVTDRSFMVSPTGILNIDVREGRALRALHGVLGYRLQPARWIDLSIETYYKRAANLFVAEWTPFPSFTTRLQPAEGRTYGLDARLEIQRGLFYGYLGYGYASTQYRAEQESLELWFGEKTLQYRPTHDRRHQLNALVSFSVLGFEAGVNWTFGSGLPFSRAIGFDGFALVSSLRDISLVPGMRRVLYDRPFDAELPTYHRLDISLARSVRWHGVSATVQASVINAYDRRNLFYLDVFTLGRVDQLPMVPSLSLKVEFE